MGLGLKMKVCIGLCVCVQCAVMGLFYCHNQQNVFNYALRFIRGSIKFTIEKMSILLKKEFYENLCFISLFFFMVYSRLYLNKKTVE